MSTDNSVVVKKFADGWRWAEVRGKIPEVDEDFINGPFATCWDAQDDARDKIDVIEYGVEILRPEPDSAGFTFPTFVPKLQHWRYCDGQPFPPRHARLDFGMMYAQIAPLVARANTFMECGEIQKAREVLRGAASLIVPLAADRVIYEKGAE